MADKRQNYCQLLGLNPLKEDTYKPEAILKKIATKKEKWANESRNKQNDTEQRFKSEKLVEATDDMVRIMQDPVLRRKEFAEAKEILRGKSQKLRMDCVILSDGTYLAMGGVAESYVKKLRWEGVTKSDVLQLAGIKEGSPPKPVSDKVLNAYKGLRAIDVHTPVEMLNNLITHPNLEIDLDTLSDGSSFSQIRHAFEICDKRVNSVRPDVLPEQDSYIQSMRSVKLVLEPDKELSDLIAYGKCNRAMAPAMDTIEQEYSGQQLSRKYIDELMNAHMTKDVDGRMAVAILQAFCYKKKIPANFSDSDSEMIRCPECGQMVPAGPNTMFCPACGKNFKTVCPQCGTAQLSKNVLCIKCGFNFKEGMEKAKGQELSFRMNMQKGLIGKAEKDLNNLKAAYAGYTGLANMEFQLNKAKMTVSSMRKIINDAYGRKRYAETKSACENLIKHYPEVLAEDPELKQKYDESVSRFNAAELYCQKATVSETREQRMEQYVNAVDICPDHPTARAKLREQPPQGPADGLGRIGDGLVTLKFEPPADSANVTYCVFRERNSLPIVTEDTRPMAEIPSCVYVDKTLEPGVEYYYSIYSKRWGVLSREGAHFGPVMILAEVDNVTIDQIDGGLRIMYEKPRGATRVRLWRSEETSGIGTEIALNGETVYDDIGLKGGKKYHYLFVAEYEGRNRTERSQGVVFSATPVDAPKPVRDMKIRWNKSDGTYTARWGTDENVVLYSSPKRISISGNMVKMDDIRSWMTEIVPIAEYTDGVKFSLPDGSIQYIYPIIPRGRVGIKGNEMLVANLKPFRDVEKTISNKDCIITMTWPEEAVEAQLVISDNEAKDLNDLDAERRTVRREEYNEEKCIRIPMGKSVKKCINIFAIYKLDNEMRPSRGIVIDVYSAECQKVHYTMKPEKSGIHMEFSADPDVREIPPIIAVQVTEGIPLKRADGEVIWRSHSPVPLTGGKGVLNIQCKALKDITKVRLFFENDENYNLYRFVHPLYNRRS